MWFPDPSRCSSGRLGGDPLRRRPAPEGEAPRLDGGQMGVAQGIPVVEAFFGRRTPTTRSTLLSGTERNLPPPHHGQNKTAAASVAGAVPSTFRENSSGRRLSSGATTEVKTGMPPSPANPFAAALIRGTTPSCSDALGRRRCPEPARHRRRLAWAKYDLTSMADPRGVSSSSLAREPEKGHPQHLGTRGGRGYSRNGSAAHASSSRTVRRRRGSTDSPHASSA